MKALAKPRVDSISVTENEEDYWRFFLYYHLEKKKTESILKKVIFLIFVGSAENLKSCFPQLLFCSKSYQPNFRKIKNIDF